MLVRGRHLRVRLLQRAQETGDPIRAALDRGHAQVRKAGEDAVARERGDRVVDRPVPGGDAAERLVAECLEGAAVAPLVGVASITRVTGMEGGECPGLGEPGPNAVVDTGAR